MQKRKPGEVKKALRSSSPCVFSVKVRACKKEKKK
jgi:hypothetical protein